MRQHLLMVKAETANKGTDQGNAEDAEMTWQTKREAAKYSYRRPTSRRRTKIPKIVDAYAEPLLP